MKSIFTKILIFENLFALSTSGNHSLKRINQNITMHQQTDDHYPEEMAAVSERNQRACNRFAQGIQAFYGKKDFELARRYMQGYRNLVEYDSFWRQDNRSAVEPLLTVVVVAYGTTVDLIHCLKSVLRGSVKQLELIVVDNGQNASVLPLLLGLPVLYVKSPANLMPSEGRNIGASFARAPIALFVDDDAVADPDLCKNALAAFSIPDVMAVRGRILPKNPTAFIPARSHYDLGPEPVVHDIDVEGNSAWRVDLFKELGGMDPLLFGHEGAELTGRLTRKIGRPSTFYWPSMLIYHNYAETSSQDERKTTRHDLAQAYLMWLRKREDGSLP